jgi:hypothetical protein
MSSTTVVPQPPKPYFWASRLTTHWSQNIGLTRMQSLERSQSNRRKDLQVTGLSKAKRKKALTIVAGILALTSAGTITT